MPKLPMFKQETDSVDAYLHRFVCHAKANNWNSDLYGYYLSNFLSGQALDIYHSMSDLDGPPKFDDLKDALLIAFQCSADDLCRRFRACVPNANESMISFSKRLRHLFQRWRDMAGCRQCPIIVDDVETLQECVCCVDLANIILVEQFMSSVSKDLAVFLREKDTTDFNDLATLA